MITTKLLDFVNQARAVGQTDDQITQSLVQQGWQQPDIQAVLATTNFPQLPSQPTPQPILGQTNQEKLWFETTWAGILLPLLFSWIGIAVLAFLYWKSKRRMPPVLRIWLIIQGLLIPLILVPMLFAAISTRIQQRTPARSAPVSSGLPIKVSPTISSVVKSNVNNELESSFYESSDIGNASTVKIRPPKGWYGSVWGSAPNLIAVMKPNGYTVKEYSYPFVDINVVQIGTKSVSVISPDNNALLEKWIVNNDVLLPKKDSEYSVNLISKEFRKFNIGYGSSNAYYVEFDLFSNKPQDTRDGPVSKLKFARVLVEAKHPNFAFDIKIVDTLENWNKNKDIIYKSLTTLTGKGSVESGEGL